MRFWGGPPPAPQSSTLPPEIKGKFLDNLVLPRKQPFNFTVSFSLKPKVQRFGSTEGATHDEAYFLHPFANFLTPFFFQFQNFNFQENFLILL